MPRMLRARVYENIEERGRYDPKRRELMMRKARSVCREGTKGIWRRSDRLKEEGATGTECEEGAAPSRHQSATTGRRHQSMFSRSIELS